MTGRKGWKAAEDLNRSAIRNRNQEGSTGSLDAPGRRRRRVGFPIAVACLCVAVLLSSSLHAAEDNARLVFQKTADSSKSRVHVVQKGEWVSSILRDYFGAKRVPLDMIRRLNPSIANLNKIRPGQRIVLPLPAASDACGPIPPGIDADAPPVVYRITEGDSISRIILSELNVNPSQVLPIYRLIRRLNPEIQDFSSLSPGQTLRLPSTGRPGMQPAEPLPDSKPALPLKAAIASMENLDAETAAILNSLLSIIGPVIGRMGGAVTAAGSYFIPLAENSQITLDCSQIPVVELDDGTTVFLDYGGRLSENLKNLIRAAGRNCAFLAPESFRDRLGGLTGIIGFSRDYRMERAENPVELMSKPDILILPDWIITGRKRSDGGTYRQGLHLLDHGEQPLPVDARAFVEKNDFIVTEIAGDRVVSSLESPVAVQPSITDLRSLEGVAFAEKLLIALGQAPIRNAEVGVSEQNRHGFNISVTGELLVRRGDRQFILMTKKLPDPFIAILGEAGTEVIVIGQKDKGRALIEDVLRGLGIPVSFGHFSCRIPEENQRTRLTSSFSALRTNLEDKPVYLIDFDIPSPVLPFFTGPQGGLVIRY